MTETLNEIESPGPMTGESLWVWKRQRRNELGLVELLRVEWEAGVIEPASGGGWRFCDEQPDRRRYELVLEVFHQALWPEADGVWQLGFVRPLGAFWDKGS